MKDLIDNQYMKISEMNGILCLSWKEETINFSDKDFKAQALQFIDLVKKLRSKKIIVDMRKFSYSLSKNLIAWRKKNVISVYNEIGVKKFAFISTSPAVNQDSPENTFVTKSFSSEIEAERWIDN